MEAKVDFGQDWFLKCLADAGIASRTVGQMIVSSSQKLDIIEEWKRIFEHFKKTNQYQSIIDETKMICLLHPTDAHIILHQVKHLFASNNRDSDISGEFILGIIIGFLEAYVYFINNASRENGFVTVLPETLAAIITSEKNPTTDAAITCINTVRLKEKLGELANAIINNKFHRSIFICRLTNSLKNTDAISYHGLGDLLVKIFYLKYMKKMETPQIVYLFTRSIEMKRFAENQR